MTLMQKRWIVIFYCCIGISSGQACSPGVYEFTDGRHAVWREFFMKKE